MGNISVEGEVLLEFQEWYDECEHGNICWNIGKNNMQSGTATSFECYKKD